MNCLLFVRKTKIKHEVDVFQKHQLTWILAAVFSLSLPLGSCPDLTLFAPQGRWTSRVLIHLRPENLFILRGSIHSWLLKVTWITTLHLNSNGSICLRLEHESSSLPLRLMLSHNILMPSPAQVQSLAHFLSSRRAQKYHVLIETF